VLFRRKDSLPNVAKFARHHDIFGTTNGLIVNHLQASSRLGAAVWRIDLPLAKYYPTSFPH
jgi:hypothetical protein